MEVDLSNVTAVLVGDNWIDVVNLYLIDIDLGRAASLPMRFQVLESLQNWVEVETGENKMLYFPLTEIKGFSTHGPSGG